MSTFRPLGHRVLIAPDAPATESAAGIVLPENRDHVPVSGTVTATGKGSERIHKVRSATVARCISMLEELIELGTRDPQEYVAELRRYQGTLAAPDDGIAVGDRVVYPVEAGLTITEDGTTYVLLNEDDVAIVVEEPADQQEAA